MATSLAKDTRTKVSGDNAFDVTTTGKPGRHWSAPVRGLVIACFLALLALEACIFVLAGSKGSPSWQVGYTVGHHLGSTARHGAGQPPAVPREKDCVPTRAQVDAGIRTRRVAVGAHRLDSGDYHEGCVGGYQAAIAGR